MRTGVISSVASSVGAVLDRLGLEFALRLWMCPRCRVHMPAVVLREADAMIGTLPAGKCRSDLHVNLLVPESPEPNVWLAARLRSALSRFSCSMSKRLVFAASSWPSRGSLCFDVVLLQCTTGPTHVFMRHGRDPVCVDGLSARGPPERITVDLESLVSMWIFDVLDLGHPCHWPSRCGCGPGPSGAATRCTRHAPLLLR